MGVEAAVSVGCCGAGVFVAAGGAGFRSAVGTVVDASVAVGDGSEAVQMGGLMVGARVAGAENVAGACSVVVAALVGAVSAAICVADAADDSGSGASLAGAATPVAPTGWIAGIADAGDVGAPAVGSGSPVAVSAGGVAVSVAVLDAAVTFAVCGVAVAVAAARSGLG
jgi:hypothetical protein